MREATKIYHAQGASSFSSYIDFDEEFDSLMEAAEYLANEATQAEIEIDLSELVACLSVDVDRYTYRIVVQDVPGSSVFANKVEKHIAWLEGARGGRYEPFTDDGEVTFDAADPDLPKGVLNLTRADMSTEYTGVDFGETDFTGADFTNAVLRNCNLEMCTLDGATFKDATLDGCTFLPFSEFVGCNFVGATLKGSFHGAEFVNCNFTDARFVNCDLSNVLVDGCCLCGTDMYGADVTGAWFETNNRLSSTTLCGVEVATLAHDYSDYCYLMR